MDKVSLPQLMEECVLSCLAAACSGAAPADVLRAYRQVCARATIQICNYAGRHAFLAMQKCLHMADPACCLCRCVSML